jgi:hypothetical protein
LHHSNQSHSGSEPRLLRKSVTWPNNTTDDDINKGDGINGDNINDDDDINDDNDINSDDNINIDNNSTVRLIVQVLLYSAHAAPSLVS